MTVLHMHHRIFCVAGEGIGSYLINAETGLFAKISEKEAIGFLPSVNSLVLRVRSANEGTKLVLESVERILGDLAGIAATRSGSSSLPTQ